MAFFVADFENHTLGKKKEKKWVKEITFGKVILRNLGSDYDVVLNLMKNQAAGICVSKKAFSLNGK